MSVVVILEGLGKRKRAGVGSVTIPEVMVVGSILERVENDEPGRVSLFPLSRNAGVSLRALRDSVDVYSLLLRDAGGRSAALHLMRFWRRRMGELIRCSTYMGFSVVQNVCDESMRSRISIDSWNSELREIFLHKASTVEKVLDFFVGRLDYERIHSEQLSSWIPAAVVDAWWAGLYLSQRKRFYCRAKLVLNWKPAATWEQDGGLLFLAQFAYGVSERCELLKLFMEDGVVLIDKTRTVRPSQVRSLFRFMLLINEEQARAAVAKIAADPTEMMLPVSWRTIIESGVSWANEQRMGEYAASMMSANARAMLDALADAFKIPRSTFRAVYARSL